MHGPMKIKLPFQFVVHTTATRNIQMKHFQLSEKWFSNSPGLINLSSSFRAIQRRSKNLSVGDLRLRLHNMVTPCMVRPSCLRVSTRTCQ